MNAILSGLRVGRRSPKIKPIFFVHIPKTAGTSFRVAATRQLGKSNVVCDYGDPSPDTSPLVKDTVYTTSDHWPLYQAIEKMSIKMLCGHVNASKYAAGMGLANLITFVRDPAQRLVSEYQHFVRYLNYTKSFEEFYSHRDMINRQSRILEGVPVPGAGFLGLTERYDASLKLINNSYGLNLKPLEKNTHRAAISEPHDISEADREKISNLNKKDVDLYKRTCELFEQRYQLFEDGLPFAHVLLKEASAKRVVGWAYWEKNIDDPVEVQVRINGNIVAQGSASSFVPTLSALSPPRLGYVGFKIPIHAKSGDMVDCVVSATGQVFPLEPKMVP